MSDLMCPRCASSVKELSRRDDVIRVRCNGERNAACDWHSAIVLPDAELAVCEDCGGRGETMTANCHNGRHTEVWEPCERCNWEGRLQVEKSTLAEL